MKEKTFKRLMKLTSFIVATFLFLTTLVLSNKYYDEAYAFGGDVVLSNGYTATSRCQISVAWSGENLQVTGYQYFANVQDYLAKGSTHVYELLFAGKTYSDTESGGLSFTTYNALQGTPTDSNYVHYIGENQGGGYNYILNQVTFCFIIPKADLLVLEDGNYNFEIKSYLYNVRYAENKSQKVSLTGVTSKIAPTNLAASTLLGDRTIESGNLKNTISVKSSMEQTFRVNATAVYSRNAASKTAGRVSGLTYITRPNNTSDTQKYYQAIGSVADPLISYLTWAKYNVNVTTASSSSVNMTLDELFNQRPDLKTQYYDARSKYINLLNTVTTLRHSVATASATAKPLLLTQLGAAEASMTHYQSIMNNIARQCNQYTSSTSNATVTNYTCSLFLDSDNYGVSVEVKNAEAKTHYYVQIMKDGVLYKTIDCGTTSFYNRVAGYNFTKSISSSDVPTGYTLNYISYLGFNGRTTISTNYGYKGYKYSSYNISFNSNYLNMGEACYIKLYYTNNAPSITTQNISYYYDEGKKFTTSDTTVSSGTNYVNIIKAMVTKISDIEDGDCTGWNNIKSKNVTIINVVKTDENNKNYTSTFYDRILPVGNYKITFQVRDKAGTVGISTGELKIEPRYIPYEYKPESFNKSYLQGTEITDEMLSSLVRIYDSVTNENLSFTTGTLLQGTYKITDKGGLNSNKVTNYTYDYYINHKAECDAENTYTITFAYCGKGMRYGTSKFATAKVTILPVFPEFGCTKNNKQIHEGYMPVYDANGKIASFTNKITRDDLVNVNFYGLYAKSYVDGDKKFLTEDVTSSIRMLSVTYANGDIRENEDFITTSNGIYGDDLEGTKNEDGTFTLPDGTIYPYRGKITFVVEATNRYGNSKKSNEGLGTTSESDSDDDDSDDDEDEDFGIIIKPITDPVLDGNDRYMYVTEEITLENLLKKLHATDIDVEGNEINITDEVIIGKVDKYDEYGNFIGTVFECDDLDALFNGGALQPVYDSETGNENFNEVLNTDQKCSYKITFYIKNENNRVASFDVIMRVVDGTTKRPYVRWTSLKYAIKIPENLDENGNNIYYDSDSIWMNDKSAYEELMYALVSMELSDVCDDDDIICSWTFGVEEGKVIKSWQMDTGIADAGNENGIAEGTLVQGYMFKDDDGRMYIVHDNPTGRMYHTYIKEDSYQRGMLPGTALNQKLYDTFYDTCCTIDNTKVAYQGHGSYCIIRDENGNFLYYDKETGKRMVSADNTLTNTWEDTRDYSTESVYVYGLKTKINVLYKDEFENNPDLALCLRVLDTIDNFQSNSSTRID